MIPTAPDSLRAQMEDAEAIAEEASHIKQKYRAMEIFAAVNPRFAVARKVQTDLHFLTAFACGELLDEPLTRLRVAIILGRRFGVPGARAIIETMLPTGRTRHRLILRERKDSELPDRGKARRAHARRLSDHALLEEVLAQRPLCKSQDDAIEAAQAKLGRPITVEGGKKVLLRAYKYARQQKFVDPNAAVAAALLGAPCEPILKISDLPRPGRPKKKTKCE